jgi:hypothetical protein
MLCSYGISDYWIYGIFLEKNETDSGGFGQHLLLAFFQ